MKYARWALWLGFLTVLLALVPLFIVLGVRFFIQQEKAGEEVYAVA